MREKYLIDSKTSIYQALSLSLSLSLSLLLGWWLGFWGCVWMRGLRVGGVFFFVRENWSEVFFGNGGILFCMKKLAAEDLWQKRDLIHYGWSVRLWIGVGCGPLHPTLSPNDWGHGYLGHYEPVWDWWKIMDLNPNSTNKLE